MGHHSRTSDRVVIVTGAGTGIGRAITQRLLQDGFRCVLAGPDKSQLEETVEGAEVAAEQATVVVTDVRDPDSRADLVGRAISCPGSLFGLVNNAGIARFAPLLDETVEVWRDTIGTNLEAGYFLAQAALRHMRDAGKGRIVNIGSIHGMVGQLLDTLLADEFPPASEDGGPLRHSAYTASKGAVIQLTRDLAAAVGRWGITVNAVSPGFIKHPPSDIERRLAGPDLPGLVQKDDPLRSLPDQIKDRMEERRASMVPLGRFGEFDDIAGPVSFLLSDDASYITGLNLVVDGGWSIW